MNLTPHYSGNQDPRKTVYLYKAYVALSEAVSGPEQGTTYQAIPQLWLIAYARYTADDGYEDGPPQCTPHQ